MLNNNHYNYKYIKFLFSRSHSFSPDNNTVPKFLHYCSNQKGGGICALVYETPLCNVSGSFPIKLCAYSSSFYNTLGLDVKVVYSPPPLQYPASCHLLEGARGSVHSRYLGNNC